MRWRLPTSVALAALLVGLFALGGVAVLAQQWWVRPLDPESASLERIGWALATEELASWPSEKSYALINRLQAEVLAEQQLADGSQLDWLTAAQQDRLAANAAWLEQRWVLLRSREVVELPPEQRPAFLDRQLETLRRWTRMQEEMAAERGEELNSSIVERVDQLIVEANPGDRDVIRQGVRMIVLRMLATDDLAESRASFREELSVAVADALDEAGQAPNFAPLTEDEEIQLQANIWLLLESWLQHQATQFRTMPGDDRSAWLDALADRVHGWNLRAWFSPGTDAEEAAGPNLTVGFLRQIPRWLRRTPESERESLQTLLVELHARLAWK